jgi:hypothetical protein
MRFSCAVVISVVLLACAGKTRREYPDNGSVDFLDMTAGGPGGALDTSEVTVHYKGALKDRIEELGLVEARVSGKDKKKPDVLRELQKEAAPLKADGIYQIEIKQDGDTLKADGYAFRFRQ